MITPPMKHPLTLLSCLLLTALPPVATAATEAKPKSENVTSEVEDLILGFRGKSKYQIVVPDPVLNAAAAVSVKPAAFICQMAEDF